MMPREESSVECSEAPTSLPMCKNNFQLSGNLAAEPVNFELPKDRNLAASCVLTCDPVTHAAQGEDRQDSRWAPGPTDTWKWLLHGPRDDNGLQAFRRY